ncbi:DUF6683 family protein [Paracoccus sp. (in: a-proteobacteria)]|uniref:DUF6683 family protein n=1 Tax=Paracoccus sp. TaxID=267 RepID=UPI003A896E82
MRVLFRKTISAPVALVLAISSAVPAAGWMSDDGALNLSIGAGSYLLSNTVLENVVKDAEKNASASEVLAETRFDRQGGYEVSLEAIVASYPAAQQADARVLFTQMLSYYPKVLNQLGQPENDLAVGMAAFIAGNYSGYHNIPFPDDKFAPLVDQMREAMQTDPQIAAMSAAEKQQLNDMLAAVGMQMVTLQNQLQQSPDSVIAGKMHEACQQLLHEALGIDADKLQITSVGMIM